MRPPPPPRYAPARPSQGRAPDRWQWGQEITNLARLDNLKDLCLNDPQYEPSPVCHLCNYATHVLYHIPQLQRLDTYDVSSKQIKELAEALLNSPRSRRDQDSWPDGPPFPLPLPSFPLKSTVMEKVMCTTTCLASKSAQRQLEEGLEKLRERKFKLQKLPEERIKLFHCHIKHLERDLADLQASGKQQTSMSKSFDGEKSNCAGENSDNAAEEINLERQFLHKLDCVRTRIAFWNKKLEEFNSCYDLILSRFCTWDFKPYGITAVKVNRVIRVHNRILRQKFEEKFQSFLEEEELNDSTNNRKKLEYLFYVLNPEAPLKKKELIQILEEGFQETQKEFPNLRLAAIPTHHPSMTSEDLAPKTDRRHCGG
ncbi:leucine-rich repeat-containing protein 9-like [Sphaerodactylus townsendi]|uniref:leucine-rich repeat-containing protein 9-like n=1 Tax=Sphaerodactylus townsendi TaxID=933632 RepID=UPI0020263E93|nr:leucine-rich repeat-containing protein 9-like [Sphaerodactylus townsendi]